MKEFDPNNKYDLDLLVEIFHRLSPEQQEEVRIGMGLKTRELGQKHLNEIGVFLTETVENIPEPTNQGIY